MGSVFSYNWGIWRCLKAEQDHPLSCTPTPPHLSINQRSNLLKVQAPRLFMDTQSKLVHWDNSCWLANECWVLLPLAPSLLLWMLVRRKTFCLDVNFIPLSWANGVDSQQIRCLGPFLLSRMAGNIWTAGLRWLCNSCRRAQQGQISLRTGTSWFDFNKTHGALDTVWVLSTKLSQKRQEIYTKDLRPCTSCFH